MLRCGSWIAMGRSLVSPDQAINAALLRLQEFQFLIKSACIQYISAHVWLKMLLFVFLQIKILGGNRMINIEKKRVTLSLPTGNRRQIRAFGKSSMTKVRLVNYLILICMYICMYVCSRKEKEKAKNWPEACGNYLRIKKKSKAGRHWIGFL